MRQVPNLFTLLNLFFGCCACVFILQNGITVAVDPEKGSQVILLPEEIWMGSLFIALAAVVDFFDGFIARWLNAESEMGKQLDSLADVVSFGVAPSLIIYQFLRFSYSRQENGLEVSWIWLAPAFLLACAAAYRLARFNLQAASSHFTGVPTPAVGLCVASFPLIYWYGNSETMLDILLNKWFWYLLVITLSYLMVSNLPLLSIKFNNGAMKNNVPLVVIFVVGAVAAFLLGWLSVPVIFIAYIIVSLAFKKRAI